LTFVIILNYEQNFACIFHRLHACRIIRVIILLDTATVTTLRE